MTQKTFHVLADHVQSMEDLWKEFSSTYQEFLIRPKSRKLAKKLVDIRSQLVQVQKKLEIVVGSYANFDTLPPY